MSLAILNEAMVNGNSKFQREEDQISKAVQLVSKAAKFYEKQEKSG